MSLFSDDFAVYIKDNNLQNGMQVYIDFSPAKVNYISVFTTGGYGRDNTLDALTSIEEPTLQVAVAHKNSTVAKDTLQAINDFIQDKSNVVIGEHLYTLFSSQGDILYLSRDDDNRAKYVLNIRTIRIKNT